jgi:hypothetical protein
MNPLAIIAGLGALVLLLGRSPGSSAPAPAPTAINTGTPPQGMTQSKPAATKGAFSLSDAAALAGAALGGGSVGDCGPKPKVPSNWLSLPKSHPARVARRNWYKCKGISF